jgi:predicted ester cyclase
MTGLGPWRMPAGLDPSGTSLHPRGVLLEHGVFDMAKDLSDVYRGYIACLNRQDWRGLEHFVDMDVSHNGRQIGLSGYRAMLEKDFHDIPDLHFKIELLVSEAPYVASRLGFDCSPKGKFLGLDINGKHVSFAENVFYEFRQDRIVRVWSVIDKAAVEAQIE